MNIHSHYVILKYKNVKHFSSTVFFIKNKTSKYFLYDLCNIMQMAWVLPDTAVLLTQCLCAYALKRFLHERSPT